MLNKTISFIVDKVPFRWIDMISDKLLLVPYYHVVSDEILSHVCNLYNYKNIKQFVSDIDFMGNKYDPISLSDLIDIVKKGKIIKRRSFLLTFDDGYKEMYYIVAPILLRKGIPAVFFLNTDFIDNKALCHENKASIIIYYLKQNPSLLNRLKSFKNIFSGMNRDKIFNTILQIKYKERNFLDKIADFLDIDFEEFLKNHRPYLTHLQIKSMIESGFYFGAHSKDHPNYSELELDEQVSQTLESLKSIKEKFNLSYAAFAFPYGKKVDNGQFWKRIAGEVDITFSTADYRKEIIKWNIYRVNFERSMLPAATILKRLKVKYFTYSFFNLMKRD